MMKRNLISLIEKNNHPLKHGYIFDQISFYIDQINLKITLMNDEDQALYYEGSEYYEDCFDRSDPYVEGLCNIMDYIHYVTNCNYADAYASAYEIRLITDNHFESNFNNF